MAMVTKIPGMLVIKLEQENRNPKATEPISVRCGRHSAKMTSAIESHPKASTLR